MAKPILCVDFDGVIHSYTSPWVRSDVIRDPPVPGALEWLWRACGWWEVTIYSSRSKDAVGRTAMLDWMRRHAAEIWGLPHPMADEPGTGNREYPIKFAHEKPAAYLTIDDRAVCFEGDWSALDPAELRKFIPWNKRKNGCRP